MSHSIRAYTTGPNETVITELEWSGDPIQHLYASLKVAHLNNGTNGDGQGTFDEAAIEQAIVSFERVIGKDVKGVESCLVDFLYDCLSWLQAHPGANVTIDFG